MREIDEDRQRNRKRFPTAPDALAWANENFPCTPGTRGHSIPYAENTDGETIGKRHPGPWCEYRRDGAWA